MSRLDRARFDRERFVSDGRPRWERLDAVVSSSALRGGADWSELASLYRSACTDLSRARDEDLGPDVLGYLDDLTARAHDRLYGARPVLRGDLARALGQDIPRQVRASWRYVLTAAALFYLPAILCLILSFQSEDLAAEVLDRATLKSMEEMYSGPVERTAGQNAMMAGFYVFNNVGIAFRCFATGALGGMGSVYFLVMNGVSIGTVFGHLLGSGQGANLLEFTSGHSAWELTGIVLAGAAGLRMGWALVRTNGLTRLASLRAAGPELFLLVMGAMVMLFVAAAIEGFWSASPIPREAKAVFAVVQLAIVTGWLGFGGRGRA